MEKQTSTIGDALFTKTQQRVLGLLYGKANSSFYLNEIVRIAGMGKGTINRELEKLCKAGLITVRRQGNQNHYQANQSNPVFTELKSIVLKSFGIGDVIKAALQPLFPQLEFAFIYGSIAKGSEQSTSDIDLMLVGESLSYAEVMGLLESAEKQLGRPINPTLLTVEEFQQKLKNQQSFMSRVMDQQKIWLKGEELKGMIDSDQLSKDSKQPDKTSSEGIL